MAQPVPRFKVDSLQVENLWGGRDLEVSFHPDVSILIGPNGCGKTTVLNILRFVLTGDVRELAQLPFDRITLRLASFDGGRTKTVQVVTLEDGLRFKISQRSYDVSASSIAPAYAHSRQRARMQEEVAEVGEALRSLVPAVWLPVSRRLPIPEDESEHFETYARVAARRRHHRLESVDQRLLELMQDLSAYRVRLDAHLSKRYKQFERAVLSLILYSEDFDRGLDLSDMPTEEDKVQLLKAFADADLLDKDMRKRVDQHFESAANALRDLSREHVTWEELLVLPLIPRTKEMVRLASELETQRVQIFSQLRDFERIANGFLGGKSVSVHDDGTVLLVRHGAARTFSPEQLSSGEKQIMILLIEALLREGIPTVYVADEPELSLHIEWQEKLLESLVELAQEVQVIVATHSPDIVGPFRDRVIEMGRAE